jgi:hypothetical protein
MRGALLDRRQELHMPKLNVNRIREEIRKYIGAQRPFDRSFYMKRE